MKKISEEQYKAIIAELSAKAEDLRKRLAKEELAKLREKYGKESASVVYGNDELMDAVRVFDDGEVVMLHGEAYAFADIIDVADHDGCIDICIAYPDVQINARSDDEKKKILAILEGIIKKNKE